MNNSAGLPPETVPDLSERAGRLTTLIEAAEMLLASREWSTLKEEFDAERYERILVQEAKKPELDNAEMYRLQGRIEVMKRFDLSHMRDKWRLELDSIKKKI